MDRLEIESVMIEVVSEYQPMKVETDVTMASNLREDLGADSIDEIGLLMVIEEHFDIVIPDEDGDACKTVGDLTDLVKKILEEGDSG